MYGLIGWPLGHSFSKGYFTEKFLREGITDARYELFPLEHIDELPALLHDQPEIRGLNVTIPHKQNVIRFLDELDETAAAVQAVNCIKRHLDGRLTGYNTDVIGFEKSLTAFLGTADTAPHQAFILGTGGAARAVAWVLEQKHIPFRFVSRLPSGPETVGYEYLTLENAPPPVLLVNCTPLGTFPETAVMPPVPAEMFQAGNFVYDLVYNPAETLLLREARLRACHVKNGLEMLYLQADAAWEIWKS